MSTVTWSLLFILGSASGQNRWALQKKLIYGAGEGRYAGESMPQTAMRREQATADVAEAVLFLTSNGAANINGQSLNVDGGMVED